MIIKKSPAEIEAMAKAGEIHVRTMTLLAGKVRAGVTTGELDAAAEKFIRSQGATPAFQGYRGFPGSPRAPSASARSRRWRRSCCG